MCHRPAPQRCLGIGARAIGRIRGGLPRILQALQARRILKANSTLDPLPILAHKIIGNEDHVGAMANQAVLLRVGVGRNQRQHRAAVWGRNRHPAVPAFEADIAHQIESQLFNVKPQAHILVAYEDIDRVNAQMRRRTRLQRPLRLLRAYGRAAHSREL